MSPTEHIDARFTYKDVSLHDLLSKHGFTERPVISASCSKGWFKILEDCLEELVYLGGASAFQIVQIKEKFGTLRFYVDEKDETMSPVVSRVAQHCIDRAESTSAYTCEVCARYVSGGTKNANGWLKTACDECFEKKAWRSDKYDDVTVV